MNERYKVKYFAAYITLYLQHVDLATSVGFNSHLNYVMPFNHRYSAILIRGAVPRPFYLMHIHPSFSIRHSDVTFL